MMRLDFKEQWVLVTGASAGMGREFAVQLAARGANLVICARQEQRLAALAGELRTQVRVVAADLASPGGVDRLLESVEGLNVPIEHVVNNAGVGGAGPFAGQNPARLAAMSALNCDALVRITHHFLPRFLERKSGGFLQVASTAAFQPVPFMAAYGATKAFVFSLSLALAEEIEGSGVRMTTLCPGPVPTEFQASAGYELSGMQARSNMSAEVVVRAALKAYERGDWVCTPGFNNSFQTFAQRFVSYKFRTKAAGYVMRKSGRDRVQDT
ncbi:MAG TPA: SDR family oxidoreductase [Polyangiaceae bacterium]|jgi:hypothetical protein|nr:SDR family oxidoreductase [Polyangiaceae bacterium]